MMSAKQTIAPFTHFLLGIVSAFLFCSTLFSQQDPADNTPPIEIAETELRSVADEPITFPPADGHVVVCFLGIECPLAKLYAPRLNEIATEFQSKGFQFIAINSNRQDSIEEWKEFAKAVNFDFPIIKDHENRIADQLHVNRNPEVLVINSLGRIQYRGRIDDQYSPGVVRAKFERQDLKIALTELASGEPVSVPTTVPTGCLIGKIKKAAPVATVTYAKDIAPIFKNSCVQCHREGEIGPFAMTDYDEVVGWADMIMETIEDQRMPPWHADPTVGEFANSRGLSEEEKQLIRTWVKEGAQLGDPEMLPEPNQYTEGWRLPRAPDQVVAMRAKPFIVPADGSVEYQYFVVDPGFTEDKWISAAEIVPGNRAVVHHSIVFIRPPDRNVGVGLNWLEAYVPGQVPVEYVPTRARRVPAGSKLVFQQHYTPNGKTESDLTKIGLIFVEEEDVEEELITLAALNQDFEIPPHHANLKVKASIPWLPKNGKLLSISPHMHYRGKSFVAIAGDEKTEKPILRVPQYDFNWQHIYEFDEPLALKDINSIEIEIAFDNSKANPFNPDPEKYVVWGDQTWEEMAVGFFNIARPMKKPIQEPAEDTAVEPQPAEEEKEEEPQYSDATIAKAKEFTDSLFEKNDANGNGELIRKEMEFIPRRNFSNFDKNQDDIVTREEVESAARMRYHWREKNKASN